MLPQPSHSQLPLTPAPGLAPLPFTAAGSPVNPPESPVNLPESPVNPPESPVNPPESPVNPPESPVNPPTRRRVSRLLPSRGGASPR
eukprot:1157007-Prorocentrum_minimum.AAC.2